MKKVLFAVAALLTVSACSDREGAERAVHAYGMKDVHTTGYRFSGCGDRDYEHTGFTATDMSGHQVSGVVCGGPGLFGKSNTVRID